MQTEVLYGNGLQTSYTYDERSQLTGMESVLPGMANPLYRGTYAYDANGCRISKTEQIRMDAKTPLKVMETCYTYESMERLTEENYHTASGFLADRVIRVLWALRNFSYLLQACKYSPELFYSPSYCPPWNLPYAALRWKRQPLPHRWRRGG